MPGSVPFRYLLAMYRSSSHDSDGIDQEVWEGAAGEVTEALGAQRRVQGGVLGAEFWIIDALNTLHLHAKVL